MEKKNFDLGEWEILSESLHKYEGVFSHLRCG